ncbi:DEAD/DEAH box helicase [Heterostelium album PN500]|uniref:RNA helicase n=1 Tax=Heterostelium pallidum (strain ATCC 26659 / Pp 5 / PN500) TaxID=670386 RepID=D3BAY0_HETP5|nr:DEAD/DEAH box helicase [Heterostelium album PN500]EFA81717.1 DEAD/DEAH box helicase [Heterostelium album PN500]|eukprot:XP_020433834.1 DEAD/DEAH box helicase [Heterostelium album PN500]
MSTIPLQRAQSKNKKKSREERLKQTLKKKIDRHAERKDLIDKLLTNSMSNDKRELLKSSATLGKKETNKESLERVKVEEKFNVKDILPEDRYKRKPKDIKTPSIEDGDNVVDQWDDVEDDDLIQAKQPVAVPSFFNKKTNSNNKKNNNNNKNNNSTVDIPNTTTSLASLASLTSGGNKSKEFKIITSLDDIDDDEESNQYNNNNNSNNSNNSNSASNVGDDRYVNDDLPKKRRGLVVPKKTADKKREEKSKKKYFFWSQDSIDRDFDEYDDDTLVSSSIRSKTVHNKSDNIIDKDENELDESEDEETINLKGNTSVDGNTIIPTTTTTTTATTTTTTATESKTTNIEKKEETKSNNNNNNSNKNDKKKNNNNSVSTLKRKEIDEEKVVVVEEKVDVVVEQKGNKRKKKDNNNINAQKIQQQVEQKIQQKEKELEEQLQQQQQQQEKENDKKDEMERYALTLDDFGKFEDENREFIISVPTGNEILEQKIKEHLEMETDIKFNVFHVPVVRLPEVIETREKLPIMMEEHNIVEKIKDNDVVIICGETGSGKTTQVPQFLYESGFAHPDSDFPGLIGVTQPRRVAAVSTAKRVAHELNVVFGKEVGYQIRYDRKLDTDVNKVKFMTDGILLREVQTDFLLQQYSCIIIDEAHERNLNTDILIGLLSRIVPMRKKLWMNYRKNGGERYTPLKIVVMSATLRVEDFTKNSNLFSLVPPVINIPTRQYPVTIHFNKKTVLDNYIDEAYRKVLKIHRRLPPGGVLVFVTGRQEVEELCTKLRRAHPMKSVNRSFKEENDRLEKEFKELEEEEDSKADTQKKHNQVYGDADSAENQLEDDNNKEEEEDLDYDDIEVVEDEDVEVEDDEDDDEDGEGSDQDSESKEKKDDDEEMEGESNDSEKKEIGPLHVLPLFSNMPTVKQMRVFQTPPLGSRLVVVATNLAETSLTIPNIKYVVDTGRVKGRFYNKDNGVSSFEVTWTSKASADQRAGRAGRTGPGHCYRIFSSAVYNDHFEQFSKPEILLIPIDGMVLQMKSMGIHNITRFPFPTPPEESALKLAMRSLCYLGALDKKNFDITELGQLMSTFPLAPRFSKMLLLGRQHNCLQFIIAIVSILTVKNPFVGDGDLEDEEDETPKQDDDRDMTEKEMEQKVKEERKRRQQRMNNSLRKWIHKESDILTILKVVGAYDFQKKKDPKSVDSFCDAQYLNSKSMGEIYKLRHQLSEMVNSIFMDEELNLNSDNQYQPLTMNKPMSPPNATQELFIKQVITAGLIDQVARIHEVATSYSMAEYRSCTNNVPVFIHPNSSLSKATPNFVVYCDVIETSKPYMKLVSEVNPAWLATLGRPLCADFKPLDMPFPKYSAKRDKVICYVKPSFGVHSWELPLMAIDHPDPKESCRYFAKALLDGVVFSPLTYIILRQFKINTKAKLAEKWFEDPQFLLKEYLPWVDESMISIVSSIWPPFDSVVIPEILLVDATSNSAYDTDEELNEDEDDEMED